MKIILKALFLTTLCAANAFGQGTVLWDESVNGGLSQDFNNPTSLAAMQIGTNSVIGMTEVVPTGNAWAGYPDVFILQIPINSLVSAIHVQVDKPDVWAWIGQTAVSDEIAFEMNVTSGELLSQWGLISIGPGTYGMYMENFDHRGGSSIANYHLDFVVQSIPEPGTLSLFALGVLGVLAVKSRRQRSAQ